jgi:hypothetical protein
MNQLKQQFDNTFMNTLIKMRPDAKDVYTKLLPTAIVWPGHVTSDALYLLNMPLNNDYIIEPMTEDIPDNFMLTKLIEAGADVNSSEAMDAALSHGNIKAANILLDHRFKVKNSSRYLIHVFMMNDIELARRLVNVGATLKDVQVDDNFIKMLPNRRQFLQLLVEVEFSIGHQIEAAMKLLYESILNRDVEMVQYLFDFGVKVCYNDDLGIYMSRLKTLHIALSSGNQDVIDVVKNAYNDQNVSMKDRDPRDNVINVCVIM